MNSSDLILTSGELVCGDSGWAWLRCCQDTQKYYKYWLKKCGVQVETPIWKSHVSVVRAEPFLDPKVLEQYIGEVIKFYYHPLDLGYNGTYWWVDVKSPQIERIRIELGLDPIPKYDLHLTIGKERSRYLGCSYGQEMIRD